MTLVAWFAPESQPRIPGSLEGRSPASTKVRAAESVLNHAEKAIELQDLDTRLAELERSAEATKPGWRK